MAVPRITRDALKQRLEAEDAASKPVIIDVRLKYPYEHSTVRLPGALRVSPHEPETAALPKDREIVAYDSDPGEIVGARVAAQLLRQGYHVSVLQGGLPEWMAASFPVETKEAPKQSAPTPGSLKG